MISKSLTKLAVLVTFILSVSSISAQNFTLEKSDILVEGTSNIHDWEMEGNKAQGTLVAENGNITSIKVQIPTESLDSGKGGMNKNAFEALKSDDNPNITFKSKNVTDKKVTGILQIAGQQKTVTIPFTTSETNQQITVKGKKTVNMTHYGVEPPTALMGTIKTGEEVTINFEFNFKQ
ncbi:YceI family protein [Zunongwangia sp.]|uniref:YceI family protein n=1 Tax=Zunongwangia sp. TaxID=1965325 RepID=UPI003AA82965